MNTRRFYSNGWRMVIWGTVGLTVAFLTQLFVVQWCFIPTGSMQNTFYPGDCILVNKLVFGPLIPDRFSEIPVLNMLASVPAVNRWEKKHHRGRLPGRRKPKRQDIVVFRDMENEQRLLVKRIMALPGDVIEIREGKVWVNGELTEERKGVVPNDSLTNDWYVLRGVKKGWTQGNFGPIEIPRSHFFVLGDNRSNSLDSRFYGYVPEKNIIGKVSLILYSAKDGKWNWKRFLHKVE